MEESIFYLERIIEKEILDYSLYSPITFKSCMNTICKILRSQGKIISELTKKSNSNNSNSNTINFNDSHNNEISSRNNSRNHNSGLVSANTNTTNQRKSKNVKEKSISKSPQKIGLDDKFKSQTYSSNYQLIKKNNDRLENVELVLNEFATKTELENLKNSIEKLIDKDIIVSNFNLECY